MCCLGFVFSGTGILQKVPTGASLVLFTRCVNDASDTNVTVEKPLSISSIISCTKKIIFFKRLINNAGISIVITVSAFYCIEDLPSAPFTKFYQQHAGIENEAGEVVAEPPAHTTLHFNATICIFFCYIFCTHTTCPITVFTINCIALFITC